MANESQGLEVNHSSWTIASVAAADLQGQIVGILPTENDIMIIIKATLPTDQVSKEILKAGVRNTYPVPATDKLYMKAVSGDVSALVVVTENI